MVSISSGAILRYVVALRDRRRAQWSDLGGNWWHPGVADDGVVQGGQHVGAWPVPGGLFGTQPGQHAVPEVVDQRDGDLVRDRWQALAAGGVGGVDQPAQRVGDLARPD